MLKYHDECCNCAVPAYPCLDAYCPHKNVPHYHCDLCDIDDSETDIYQYNYKTLCRECLLQQFTKLN